MQATSLFVRQIGINERTMFSMYEIRDARDQNHVIALVSGPGDDGIYREILEDGAYRKLTQEELDRVNKLIQLQDQDSD